MPAANIPANEQDRLTALLKLKILDTAPDEAFDKITSLAQTIFQVPIVLVSLIDEQRQWFKSKQGLDVSETDRKLAFCAHAILHPRILIVEDAQQDERFSSNSLVCAEPNIRFYAGCPLIDKQGYALGTLCLIDRKPRQMSSLDKTILQQLAALVMERIYAHQYKLQTDHKMKLLSLLVDAMPEALVSCDSEGQLEQFNKIARAWHGIDIRRCEPELLSYYYDLYEEDGQTVLAFERIPLIRAFHGETIANEVICIKAKGQPLRWVSCNGGQIKNDAGQVLGALILMQDISEQKRLATMKTEFISTVSHELRTPITAIMGSLDLLNNGVCGPLPEQALAMLQIASQNSKKLQFLVNDLLDMEKFAAGKMEFNMQTCDLAQECKKAVAENQPFADKYQVQITQLSNEPCPLSLDSSRLQQVLSNLLSNAIKFSPAGAEVCLSYHQVDEKIRLQVEDKGEGIPFHFQERIFQRFSQADSSDSRKGFGTGLGLAISKAIVESMGGQIGFHSVPGQGSIFFCDFIPPADNSTIL